MFIYYFSLWVLVKERNVQLNVRLIFWLNHLAIGVHDVHSLATQRHLSCHVLQAHVTDLLVLIANGAEAFPLISIKLSFEEGASHADHRLAMSLQASALPSPHFLTKYETHPVVQP